MQSTPIFIAEMNSTKRYYIKAFTSINNNMTTTITSYPTTEGTPMSDHSYREPYSLSISLISSELNSANNYYFYLDELNDSRGEQQNLTMNDLKKLLFAWKEEFTRLTIQTRLYQYTNMIITGISFPEDNSNLGQFNPTITFSECRTASIYTEQYGPYDGYESKGTYDEEQDLGTSNGVSVGETVVDFGSSIIGGAVAGAAIGKFLGGKGVIVGAVIGGAWGLVTSFINYLE